VAAVRVKVTALVGDNRDSGLLVDANYAVHHGPDDQGRVLVFDFITDSFRTVTPAEYREVPDPLDPHELVRITQDPDGYRAMCRCVWRHDLPAADPDAAVSAFKRLHLRRMEEGRYHLTAWNDPRLIQLLDRWHKQQWHRRRQEPER
jgi:hypothetical protein